MSLRLTIGIPTYNRAHSLEKMLAQLSLDIGDQAQYVEVVISDNCSPDDTANIIDLWMRNCPEKLTVRVVKKDRNVGISKNLISLFYLANAPYFTILGDDDRLSPKKIRHVLNLLADEKPSAIIQAFWGGELRGKRSGPITFEEAGSLFYEYGNAWAGIVDTKAAINAIERRGLLREIEDIVWPQTVMAFLAMFDLSPERKAFATEFELGGPLGEPLNITNKTYHINSLRDLLKAASVVQQVTKSMVIGSKFVHHKSPGFIGHVKAIFWFSLIDEDCANIDPLRHVLSRNFGVKGMFWSMALKLSDYPKLLFVLCALIFMCVKWERFATFSGKVARAREKHLLDIANIEITGKRYGDWH